MLSLPPIQMGGLQTQQADPLRSLNNDNQPNSNKPGSNGSILAEMAMSGEGVPWGNLYDNLQTEYWNRLLRDPNTGSLATVKVRDRTLKPAEPTKPRRFIPDEGGGEDELPQYEYGDWQDISILDYLRDMEKYYSPEAVKAPFNPSGQENPNMEEYQRKMALYQNEVNNDRTQGALADYFEYLLPNREDFNYSWRTGSFDQYGDNLINWLGGQGVDLEMNRPWVRNPQGTDYDSISGQYLDNYLDKYVYGGGYKNQSGVKKFGTGGEDLRWFADDENLTDKIIQADLRGAGDRNTLGLSQPSMFGTVSSVLSPYANATGRTFSLDSRQTGGKNTPGNVRYDSTFGAWENAQENRRKYEAAKKRAENIAPLAMMASFAAPWAAPAIGGAMGLTGAAAAIGGGALYGGLTSGLTSALSGGNVGKGFLTGAIGGGLGGYFGGGSNFAAGDAAQLAAQGLSPSQISTVLGYTGVSPGMSGLYGTLSSAGLTNPGWASATSSLIKGGAKSLASGQKFDPVRSAVGGYLTPNIGALPTQLAMQALR